MTRPVTSTKVATKGADEVAGSKPAARSKNGSMAPVTPPQTTTQAMEIETERATRNQCGP